MQNVWSISVDDYLAIIKLAKEHGKKPGDDMTDELIEYTNNKNIEPVGKTELNKDEYIKELSSHDKKILSIETDAKGQTSFNIHNTIDKGKE